MTPLPNDDDPTVEPHMRDPQTIQDDEPIYDADGAEGDRPTEVWEDDEPQELPRRPKRRLVTPWTVALAAILVAALGFIGGVQVQKGEQDDSAAAGGLPAGLRAAAGARGFGGAAAGAGQAAPDGTAAAPTTGKVASKDGSTLYVTDSSGATIKVRTNGNSEVTRTAKGKVAGVHPGDTVVITGTTNDNGTVTASAITATASGVTTGFGGGGFPGGAGGAGGGGFPGGTGGNAPGGTGPPGG